MVLALALLSIVSPVLADDLIDSANLLQARKTSKISKKQQQSPGMVLASGEEDCTGKDMYLWLGGHREEATTHNTKLWVMQTSQEFSTATTVAYAKTKGKSCAHWCEAQNKVCVRGMDDAHHQVKFLENHVSDGSRCSLFPSGHKRKSTDEAGCKQNWGTQMCACGEDTPLNMGAHECANDEETDTSIRFRACGVATANPNDPYDHTHPVDLLLKDQDGASGMQINKNDNGNLVITSHDDYPVAASLTDPPGRHVILPAQFTWKVKFLLKEGESVTVHEPEAVRNAGEFGISDDNHVIQYPAPDKALEFNALPLFSVHGDDVEVEMSATTNLVAECYNGYTHLYDNKKVKYQSGPRLWRKVNQTIDACYEACAADARCKYFSFDAEEGDRWHGCCMGGTGEAVAQSHTHFKYYEVCQRSDVRGQCDQHDEHSCKSDSILPDVSLTGVSAADCHEACKTNADCALFAYDPSSQNCQICQQHYVFQGRGTGSSWGVMGKGCEDDEVSAKFG